MVPSAPETRGREVLSRYREIVLKPEKLFLMAFAGECFIRFVRNCGKRWKFFASGDANSIDLCTGDDYV